MSVEAILAVVTVVLAIAALIPRERSRDLRIRIGGVAYCVAWLSGILVLYWALLEEIHSLPWLRQIPRSVEWLPTWGPASASLITLLGAAGIGWWSYVRRLPVYRVPKLAGEIADALARRRYNETLHLLETHFETIRAALEGAYWQAKTRELLLPSSSDLHMQALEQRREIGAGLGRRVGRRTGRWFSLRPIGAKALMIARSFLRWRIVDGIGRAFERWAEVPREAAHDLIRMASLTPALPREIATANPYFALQLFELSSGWVHRELLELYADELVRDPESVLYRELRRAQNIDLQNVPVVDQVEQPLLSALCADVSRSQGPSLLYTFVECGIDWVRWGRTSGVSAMLDGPIADFHERGRWNAPPFATIYLLTVVVPRAAVDPRAVVINLYSLQSLVTALLARFAPIGSVDFYREWPTPTHYLVYEAVSLLKDTVLIQKERPLEIHSVLAAQTGSARPLTLPLHAIDVLGSTMITCLRSSKLDPRFKGYLLEVWWDAYADKYAGRWSQSDRVLQALAKGRSETAGGADFRAGLAEAMERVDLMLQISPDGDLLRAECGLPPRAPPRE